MQIRALPEPRSGSVAPQCARCNASCNTGNIPKKQIRRSAKRKTRCCRAQAVRATRNEPLPYLKLRLACKPPPPPGSPPPNPPQRSPSRLTALFRKRVTCGGGGMGGATPFSHAPARAHARPFARSRPFGPTAESSCPNVPLYARGCAACPATVGRWCCACAFRF